MLPGNTTKVHSGGLCSAKVNSGTLNPAKRTTNKRAAANSRKCGCCHEIAGSGACNERDRQSEAAFFQSERTTAMMPKANMEAATKKQSQNAVCLGMEINARAMFLVPTEAALLRLRVKRLSGFHLFD